MNIRRTPQAAQSSPSSGSLATAVPTTKNSASSTSWDSAHWEVGTLPPSPTAPNPGPSQGNNSPFSNTGAFAGVIVGVSVSCLIIIGFFIYRIKYPKFKPHILSQHPARFSQLASSTTTGPITLPPQPALPALPDRTPEHDQPPDHNSSNPFSSRRSSRRIPNNLAASSDASPRSGLLFTPPGTPTHRNILELSQRSEQTSLSQPNSRSIFDFFSSASSGTSHPGRGARMSAGAVSSATSQATSLPRPLPFPSHSPPPYSSKRASLRHSSQNNSGATSPLASVFPSDEKRLSLVKSDGISQAGQPKTSDEEYPVRYTVPSTGDKPDAGGLQSPFGDPPRPAVSSTRAAPARALRDSMMSSTSAEMQHGDAPPSSWRSALSPFQPRPTSTASDPFNNKGFEIPGWLDSDPYSRPGEGARNTTSVYSVAQRSVAASSKILPSDTSLRTLSPEPSEDNHSATVHVAVLTRFRTTSIGHGTEESAMVAPGESVEGDGPESFAVRISSGPERKGWGREDLQRQSQHEAQRTIPSGSRATPRSLQPAHASPAALQPALAPSSPPPTSIGVPLSAEYEARGLGRSFIQSLISKVRWPSTTASDHSHLPREPREATWLREDPFEMPRASMGAASSKLLPSDAGHGDASSIHSNQAEMGWIEPQLGPTNRQSLLKPILEPVNEPGVVDASLSAINQGPVAPDAQDSQSRSEPRSSPPS